MTKTRGGIQVTNAADDGKRPKPVGKLKVPIRCRAEQEMALNEELASGKLGETEVSLHRTFDGHFWVYIDGQCYVIAFEDIIRETVKCHEAKAAKAKE